MLLDRYFQRPIGYFTDVSGIQHTFSDLTYAEYFTLFRLTRFDIRNISNTRYYDESPANSSTNPRMHVVQRDPLHTHLSRVDAIRPSQGELFYLHAILQSRATLSFVDAHTVNNVIHQTFQEAAIALGLFADQNEAQYAIDEAIATLATPRQLRQLFVHLLVNDCILTSIDIWTKYQQHMARDFTLQLGFNMDLALNCALEDLNKSLEEHGKSLSFYGLPDPITFTAEVQHELERWGRDPIHLRNRRVATAIAIMTHEQHFIYSRIMSSVLEREPLLAFIDGKAGRGKTFLINAICDKIHSLGCIVIPTATAAFAAQLYPGGRTTHSAFKVSSRFPFSPTTTNSMCTITGPSKRQK